MDANEIVERIKSAKIGKEVLDIWQEMHGKSSVEDTIEVHQGAFNEIMQSLAKVYPEPSQRIVIASGKRLTK
jgi:hypothetical protein